MEIVGKVRYTAVMQRIIRKIWRTAFTCLLLASCCIGPLAAKNVPAIYLVDQFAVWQTAGAASPYLFPLSATLRYNPSASVFYPENDVSFAYKPLSYTAEDIVLGLSFNKYIFKELSVAAIVAMFSTVNVLKVGASSADDTLTGYASYLLTPSVAYKLNEYFSLGGELEFSYQSFASEGFVEADVGLSGTFRYDIFTAGLAVKNVVSPFINGDMPFMVVNTEGISLLDKRLFVSLGLVYRMPDSHFGVAAGVRWLPLDYIEVSTAYNDGNVSFGASCNFSSIRFDYAFAYDIFNRVSPYKHTVGVSLFYTSMSFGDSSLMRERLEEIKKNFEEGRRLLDSRRYSEAIEMWNRILAVDPNHAQAKSEIARAQLEMRKVTSLLIQDGVAAINNSDYPAAIQAFSEALKYDRDNEDAKKYIAQIGKLSAEEREKYQQMAKVALDKGDNEGALRSINIALALDPSYAPAKDLKRDIQDAILRQSAIDKRLATGKEFIASGRNEMAAKSYDKAIALFEKSLPYFDGENRKKAEGLIEQAKRMKANAGQLQSASVYLSLANEADEKGDREKAILNLKKAIELYPDYDEAKQKLADIDNRKITAVSNALLQGKQAFDAGDYAAAAKAWKSAVELDSDNKLARDYLDLLNRERDTKLRGFRETAEQAYNKGNFAAAKENFEKASALSPEDKGLKESLQRTTVKVTEKLAALKSEGVKLASAKNYNDAKKTFSEMLVYDTENELAKTYISEIKAAEALPGVKGEVTALMENRRFADALKRVESLTNIQFKYLDGLSAYVASAREMAERAGKELEKQEKDDALNKKFEEGAANFRRKKYSEAIAIWKEVLAADASNDLAKEYIAMAEVKAKEEEDKNYNNALEAIKKKDWYTAREELTKALAANPNNENAKNELRTVNYEMEQLIKAGEADADRTFSAGDYAAALAAYDKLLKMNTANYRVQEKGTRVKMAIEYAQKASKNETDGKIADAIAAYNEVLNINPDDKRSLSKISALTEQVQREKEKNINEGNDYFAQGDYYRAIKRWEILLPILTGRQKDEIAGKINEAKKKIEDVKKEILANARRLAASRQYTAAIREYQRAIEADPQNVQARQELDDVEYKLKASQVAVRANVEEEVRQKFAEGIEYYKTGDYRKAIAAWERVLAVDPSNDKARSYIGRAKNKLELTGN